MHAPAKCNSINEITSTVSKGHIAITIFPLNKPSFGGEAQSLMNVGQAFCHWVISPDPRECLSKCSRHWRKVLLWARWPVVEEDLLDMEYVMKRHRKASQRKISMLQYSLCEAPKASVEHVSIMLTKMSGLLHSLSKESCHPNCYHKLPIMSHVLYTSAKDLRD